ncbi:MAG: response regulator [Candidatus Margulisbacteria bacterium]|nr:response regulator [Candidatus Margulisiibacteriota bacterium]
MSENISENNFDLGNGPDGRPFKFYIIDDSVFMIKTLRDIIESFGGYVVGGSANAIDAMACLKKVSANVDIITLDINMPGMDGMTLLPILRGILPNVKIVVISALGKVESIKKTILLGANHFILKPFKEKQMFNVFNYLCHLDSKAISGQKRITNHQDQPLRIFAVETDEAHMVTTHTILDWFGCNIVGVSINSGKELLERIKNVQSILDVIMINSKLKQDIPSLIKKIIEMNPTLIIVILTDNPDSELIREIFKNDSYHRITAANENNLFEKLTSLFPLL